MRMTSDKKKLKAFCANPSYDVFRNFDETTKEIIYKLSKYCIDNNKGKLSLAKKFSRYYISRDMSDETRNALKAVFRSLKLLKTKEFEKARRGEYPRVIVQVGRLAKYNFIIDYNSHIKEMFRINQKIKKLGVDKEISLYEDDIKDYLVEIFSKYPDLKITKIGVQLAEFTTIDNFYLAEKGIVWDKRKAKKSKVTKPKPVKPNTIIKKGKLIVNNNSEVWECPVCEVLNPKSEEKCLSCETAR